MGFALVPYIEIDGQRILKDSQIRELWNRTVKDGLVETMFHDGAVDSDERFLAFAKSNTLAFYVLKDGDYTVGYTWLNGFECWTARQHFCVFKEYWGKTIDIGKFVLNEFMSMKDEYGKYRIGTLVGVVPSWNDRAIKFSEKCGGKISGVIPNYTGDNEPGTIICYTREES